MKGNVFFRQLRLVFRANQGPYALSHVLTTFQAALRRLPAGTAPDRPVHALVAVYAAATTLLLALTGTTAAFAYVYYLPAWSFIFFVFYPLLYFLFGILHIVHRVDRRRWLAVRIMFSVDRLVHFASGLLLLAAMLAFQGACSSVKNALPVWNGGFRFDVVQANLDQLLHFGRAPWEYLYLVAGYPSIRSFIEWNYNQGWFIFCFTALFWVAVSVRARTIRCRYFLCYCLCWIVVGNILAGLFLSAGPAYYGFVTGDAARFVGQMSFLREGSDGAYAAVRFQAYLWSLFESGQAGFGSGISAFPSMHVSLVTLNALFLLEWNRKWGAVALAYVAFVLASSVYLAWHYAIDGYVAAAVTALTFVAVRQWMSTSALAGVRRGVPLRA